MDPLRRVNSSPSGFLFGRSLGFFDSLLAVIRDFVTQRGGVICVRTAFQVKIRKSLPSFKINLGDSKLLHRGFAAFLPSVRAYRCILSPSTKDVVVSFSLH